MFTDSVVPSVLMAQDHLRHRADAEHDEQERAKAFRGELANQGSVHVGCASAEHPIRPRGVPA